MKKLLLGLALCGLTFACANTEEKASFADAEPVVCADCEAGTCTECPDAAKSECAGAMSECAGAKSECAGEAPKVCPVTGKEIN